MKKLINETETFVDANGVEHTIVRTVEKDSILDIFKKKNSEDAVEDTDKKIDFKKIGKRAAIIGAAGAAILGGIAIGRRTAKKNDSDEDDRYITVNTTNDSVDTPSEEAEPQETNETSDVTVTYF